MLISVLPKSLGLTIDSTSDEIYEALRLLFPDVVDLLNKTPSMSNITSYSRGYYYVGELASGSSRPEYSITWPYFNATPYKSLNLTGSASIGDRGESDPTTCTLVLEPENSANSKITVFSFSGQNASRSMSNVNLSNLTGNYRLRCYGNTTNDGVTVKFQTMQLQK